MRWSVLSLFLSLISTAVAVSSSGSRLLVVLEDESKKDTYSKFWSDLKSRGFEVDFQSPKSSSLALFKLGERAYDHAILLPPTSKAYGSALSPQVLLDFIKAEGNVILGLSGESTVPTQVVSLLLELDIHLAPERNAVVVDHFNFDAASAAENHDVLVLDAPASIRGDVKNFFKSDAPLVVPRAVGQELGNANPLLTPILKAPVTAYTYSPKEDSESADDSFASGSQLALVSAIQARNSARFTVLGSTELLEDKWFDTKVKFDGKSVAVANRDFAKQLSAWTFKEIGVLKVGRLQHHAKSESSSLVTKDVVTVDEINPDIYRIKEDVTFAIEISEYDNTHFAPYAPPSDDEVQLEVTMLSPFHRLPLKAIHKTANSTIFGTSLTLPDQHGIFNFRVNYKRPFLTTVDEKRQFTLRHFAHDEYPRSWTISGAWTWIAGIWVTIAAWVLFVAIWLWSAPKGGAPTTKKTQ